MPSPTDVPKTIGPYRVLEPLGAGGMGAVYKAEQREPVRRLVAIKVVQPGMATQDVLARFQLERRALAAMSHRCIAKVFDAGVTEQGQPYFVMELVEGLPLTEYCDKHKLSLPDRLNLFQQVCSGVQHAHLKGVIHRDLKPGNVLVTREGEDAVPKILDFGLAKATNRDFLEATLFTEKDQILGTPEYMSPEQAAGDGEVIDARTDVYSLGVMLYELLSGELPFSTHELRKAGAFEAMRLIQETEPQKPSTRLRKAADLANATANNRRSSTGALSKALKGDLDWVVMRALAKEPERRYDTPNGLANDLVRFLAHEPVSAGPPTFRYRAQKFARKYRGQLVAAGLLLVSILAGAVIATYLAIENATLATERGRLAAAEAEQRGLAESALANFDQIRKVQLLQDAKAAEVTTYPAWPENLEAIGVWLGQRAEPLIAAVSELNRAREEVAEDEFLHSTITKLIDDIGTFEAEHVTRVRRRERWARQVEALTLGHPNAAVTWKAARDAIRTADGLTASELYRSDPPFELVPQCGLVPIGMNPATLLWEFYHLRSAWLYDDDLVPRDIPIPSHRADASIEVRAATGIVFVLIPGGKRWLGGQPNDENGPNYTPQAAPDEKPHEVSLVPYLLARHELTQAQFVRLSGEANPSEHQYARRQRTWTHPVEQVDRQMAGHVLELHGLLLPTEAQWENGCRGGTDTVWFPGNLPADLNGFVNISDSATHKIYKGWGWSPEVDDGWATVHAPVGTFRANPFGLFDVHGNVWEWCRDSYSMQEPRSGDGLRPGAIGQMGVYHGGSYATHALLARSSFRYGRAASTSDYDIGLRAARAVRLDDFTASRQR